MDIRPKAPLVMKPPYSVVNNVDSPKCVGPHCARRRIDGLTYCIWVMKMNCVFIGLNAKGLGARRYSYNLSSSLWIGLVALEASVIFRMNKTLTIVLLYYLSGRRMNLYSDRWCFRKAHHNKHRTYSPVL